MIVLDASVIIAYLDRDDAHHDRAEALLAREIDEDFATSALTLAEVLVAPARLGRIDLARVALDELQVRELPLPEDTAVRLAQLRAGTGRKLSDCCVLLAAEHAHARVATFDEGLVRAAESRGLEALHS